MIDIINLCGYGKRFWKIVRNSASICNLRGLMVVNEKGIAILDAKLIQNCILFWYFNRIRARERRISSQLFTAPKKFNRIRARENRTSSQPFTASKKFRWSYSLDRKFFWSAVFNEKSKWKEHLRSKSHSKREINDVKLYMDSQYTDMNQLFNPV